MNPTRYPCERCRASFELGIDLRNHYRRFHGVPVRQERVFWPDLTPQEAIRAGFWRYSWLEGWAFASEEVAA